MSARYHPEPIANYHCACGENPLWDERRQMVYWTDIPNGRLYRWDYRTGAHERFYSDPAGKPIGGFTLQADGALLLFGHNTICRLDPDSGELTTLVRDFEEGVDRFNDVIADPRGRVFAGTMGPDGVSGGLYRVDLDGSITCLFRGTGCSNGMGFSPDLKLFYWTDSTAKRIFRFDYDFRTGELSNRREFLAVPESEGTPDGMTTDSEGCVWSARWDGCAVYRYSPAGEQVGKIGFPVAKVSSVIFGGTDLGELFVTTAGGEEGSATPDGTLYRVKVAARGLPEFRSRVMVGETD